MKKAIVILTLIIIGASLSYGVNTVKRKITVYVRVNGMPLKASDYNTYDKIKGSNLYGWVQAHFDKTGQTQFAGAKQVADGVFVGTSDELPEVMFNDESKWNFEAEFVIQKYKGLDKWGNCSYDVWQKNWEKKGFVFNGKDAVFNVNFNLPEFELKPVLPGTAVPTRNPQLPQLKK
jgi:hypothetical protein